MSEKTLTMDDQRSAAIADLDQTLARIVQRAQALVPFDSGGILIFDRHAQLLAPHTYRQSTPDAPLPHLVKLGEGILGYVAQSQQPLLANDVSAEPRYIAYDSQMRAQLAVPIALDGDLLGVFNVESATAGAYTPQHVTTLQAFADHAALAIRSVQQTSTQSRRLQRLTDYTEELFLRNEISHLSTSDAAIDDLLPKMAEHLAKLIETDACALTLWDVAGQRAQRLAAFGIDLGDFLSERFRPAGAQSLTGRIVDDPQVHIINDAQSLKEPPTPFITEYNARAVLAMPLMARGRAIGATFLMNLHDDRPFAQADADKIASVLDQIALSIDNHVLFTDMQARLSETSVLLEIAAIAASSLELDDMLRQVLKLSQKMLGVQCGAFLLYDPHNNTLHPRDNVSFGFPTNLNLDVHMPVADPRSQAAIVFMSGSPMYINDMQTVTQDPNYPMAVQIGLRNALLAPLRVQDEALGIFLVGNKPTPFNRTDARLLTAMGSHVAAALRNADLLADTRERLRETEALQQIAAITSSSLDLDQILERAVREAAELLGVEGAILMMPDPTGSALIPHDRSRYGIAKQLPFEPIAMDGSGHIVHVYHTGHPYISNQPPTDPIFERRNIITYPLNTRNLTLGTLSLINRLHGEFEETHIELTRAICSQIATSMENAQLFAGERARADLMSLINNISQELTATLDLPGLIRKVVKAIHELLGYETVSLLLLDENGQNITVQASISSLVTIAIPEGYTFPITAGVVGRAVRTGETQYVPDINEDADFFYPAGVKVWGSDLVVPLRARTRVLGAIEAIANRPNGFIKTDEMAMETLAAQVSIAIENARLWNQAQRRLLEQGIVHQIGQDLTSILDYNELVNAVVQHMTRALDTSVCVLTAFDAETGRHTVEAEYRIGEMTRNSTQYALPSYVGQPLSEHDHALIDAAILTRRQVLVYRDGPAQSARQQKTLSKLGIWSELVLPMIAGDRVMGCVLWVEVRAAREFTPGDVRLAQTLTTQAAIAIENARLFRQAQRQAREQALLRRIAVGLSVMPDLESLLRQLAFETAAALEIDTALISLHDENGNFPINAQYPARDASETFWGRTQLGSEVPTVIHDLEEGRSVVYNSKVHNGSAVSAELEAVVNGSPISLILTPVVRRGETIGLIEVSTPSTSRMFDQKEVQLLEAIANQGAIAIDNVSLSQREQQRLRQLEKLQASSRNIAGQLQTELLMKSIVREAASIFDANAVSLMTRDPGDEFYAIRASLGLSDRYVQGRKMRISDYNQEPTRPSYRTEIVGLSKEQEDIIRGEGLRSILQVPLVKAGQQLGILNLHSKDKPRAYTDEERDLAQLFASQAATAVENARLFEALEERAVELAKVNQLKSEFLARVSHELRTPMNSIIGYSDMLIQAAYGELTSKQNDRVERILRNGHNLLAIIDDLLDISKIDAGKMELQIVPVNLREELNSILYNLESQTTSKGLFLKLDAPENLPPILADSMRLKQITTNLLGNAIKFTKEGGVTVRVEVKDEKGKPMIWTSVTDTGIGIKREHQEIIFDEFRQADGSTTREYGGTGLGLAITKKLVEMMQGRIWVDSVMGKGSTFTFVLPAAP